MPLGMTAGDAQTDGHSDVKDDSTHDEDKHPDAP
jgi:hypothetical protein